MPLLTACEEIFTPDMPHTPVLCVNSIVTAGKPITVSVSKSRLYTDTTSSATVVDNAAVNIYANGQLQDEPFIPRQGDDIRIAVQSPTLGCASADVTVPHAVPTPGVEWEASDIIIRSARYGDALDNIKQHEISFRLKVRLTVADIPGDTFFRFSYDCNSKGDEAGNDSDVDGDWSTSGNYGLKVDNLLYDLEPIWGEHIGIFESLMGADAYGFTFFTDRQFSGKTYTLNIQFEDCRFICLDNYIPEDELSLRICTISQSYYNWSNYLWQRDRGTLTDLGDYGFGDPVWGYSNVSSGAGVVAAQSESECKINLTGFIEEILKQQSDRD